MNTVGKILVILNFLFAVVVGAFLVVDFAVRTNWRQAHDKIAAEYAVLSTDREAFITEGSSQRTNVKTLMMDYEKVKSDMKDAETQFTVQIDNLKERLTAEQDEAKKLDLVLKKTIADSERLKTSEVALKDIIKDREKAVLDLQELVKSFRTQAASNELAANQLNERNQQLQEELTRANQLIARLKDAGAGGGGNLAQIVPNATAVVNPPVTMVKGKVERVDAKDSSLVLISVGTDHGVNNGNTMEVFRTQPQAKYLGMVRIVDASPRESVGRLVVPPGAARPQLQAGDNVWSKLRQ